MPAARRRLVARMSNPFQPLQFLERLHCLERHVIDVARQYRRTFSQCRSAALLATSSLQRF